MFARERERKQSFCLFKFLEVLFCVLENKHCLSLHLPVGPCGKRVHAARVYVWSLIWPHHFHFSSNHMLLHGICLAPSKLNKRDERTFFPPSVSSLSSSLIAFPASFLSPPPYISFKRRKRDSLPCFCFPLSLLLLTSELACDVSHFLSAFILSVLHLLLYYRGFMMY